MRLPRLRRVKEPAMPLSQLPALLATAFSDMARWLQKRSAARLPLILTGILFARGRRTVTSWFRACGIRDDFRNAYTTVCATGRHTGEVAISALHAVKPLLGARRLRLAIDDTPTPGPAGEKHVYGHVWVTLTALARHNDWGAVALPLQAQLYVRQLDVERLPPERPREFRTKLEMAVEQLRWA